MPERIEDRSAQGDKEARLRGLLLAGMAGDAAAYRTFLSELGAHLRGFLRRRLARLPADVEDLVQETMLAVHIQRHTYDPAQPLTAWVQAIARYKMVDVLRRRALREALHEPLEHAADILASSETGALDARRDLDRLLVQLPSAQREMLVSLKVEGVSVAEIARSRGLSESAVKVSVHRALKKLAALIRDRDEDR